MVLFLLLAEIIDPIDIADFESLCQNQWCYVFQHDINDHLITYGAPVKDLKEISAPHKGQPAFTIPM
jgi:hypothetical protein